MSGQASQAGESLGNAIKKGVGMFHGAGEAIRGNVNAAVDSAAGDKQSAARHEETASHGAREMDQGYSRHHQGSAGTTHTGLDRDNNMNSSNYGPHDTNLGNKMDPRFDSDLDGRGTTSGSTNYGPHDTNLGNKMDPRYDSDLDNRGTTTGSTNYGPHETNMANRMDPRFDAEMNTRSPGYDPTFHSATTRPLNSNQDVDTRRDSLIHTSTRRTSETFIENDDSTSDSRPLVSIDPIPEPDSPDDYVTQTHFVSRRDSEPFAKTEYVSDDRPLIPRRVSDEPSQRTSNRSSTRHHSRFLNILDPRTDART